MKPSNEVEPLHTKHKTQNQNYFMVFYFAISL